MTRRISVAAALAASALACAVGLAAPAAAKVTKLEITSKDSFGTFKPGEYVWWQGRITANWRRPKRSRTSTRPRRTPAAWWNIRRKSR